MKFDKTMKLHWIPKKVGRYQRNNHKLKKDRQYNDHRRENTTQKTQD